MSDKKDLYGYEEEDIMTLEFDDGEATECGIPVSYTHLVPENMVPGKSAYPSFFIGIFVSSLFYH